MPRFKYKAANSAGELLEGEMDAVSKDVVIRRLQAQGHVPIRAEPMRDSTSSGTSFWSMELSARRVTQRDVMLFTVELATLLEAGLPLDRALEILEGMSDIGPLKSVVREVRDDVRGGKELSAAMTERSNAFSTFYVNLVRAGEASGGLERTLTQLAEFTERAREIRNAVTSALIYPVLLVSVGSLCLAAVLGIVVPRLAAMFEGAEKTLPWYTQVTVASGDFIAEYWWILGVGTVAVFLVFRADYRSTAGRRRWDRLLLGLPLIGGLIEKLEAGRFCRTLGTLVKGGVSLIEAMQIAREVIGNRVISEGVAKVVPRVGEGEGLAKPLQEVDVMPTLAVQLLRVGEETGRLEDMLLKVADIYDRDVHVAVDRVVQVLGPVLILGLAAVIAGIVVSVMVPLLSLNELAF